VAFDVDPHAYDRFMGRYSELLAPQLADLAGVDSSGSALDVGCGTGALTGELVRRLGTEAVSAVDPSESFAAAVGRRFPGIVVQRSAAEGLPFDDDSFDVAAAQLVVHFMADPVAGLGEMARVVRTGGVVAACVWDLDGGQSPLSLFWEVARSLDPDVRAEATRPGAREGHLTELFDAAGVRELEQATLTVELTHASFDEWWEPFALGVGPAGDHVAGLAPQQRAALRDRCRAALPDPPFTVKARAWAVRGLV